MTTILDQDCYIHASNVLNDLLTITVCILISIIVPVISKSMIKGSPPSGVLQGQFLEEKAVHFTFIGNIPLKMASS